MSNVYIHDNGVYKHIITGAALIGHPEKLLAVGDKYIDDENNEITIMDKKIVAGEYLQVTTIQEATPLTEPQIINLATNEYQEIPKEVQQKIKLWDKVKGWFK